MAFVLIETFTYGDSHTIKLAGQFDSLKSARRALRDACDGIADFERSWSEQDDFEPDVSIEDWCATVRGEDVDTRIDILHPDCRLSFKL